MPLNSNYRGRGPKRSRIDAMLPPVRNTLPVNPQLPAAGNPLFTRPAAPSLGGLQSLPAPVKPAVPNPTPFANIPSQISGPYVKTGFTDFMTGQSTDTSAPVEPSIAASPLADEMNKRRGIF